jgi:hypothetical protein
MQESLPIPSSSFNVRPVKRGKRAEMSPRQLEILDWIEQLIVPALVEKYIQERVLNREANRG